VNISELKEELNKIVRRMEEKLPYASAFASFEKGKTAHASQTALDASLSQTVAGVTITGFNGQSFIEKCTSAINAPNLNSMADKIIAKALDDMRAPGFTAAGFEIDPGEKMEKDFETPQKIDAAGLSLDYFMDEAKRWRDVVPTMSKFVANCGCRLGAVVKESLFVNRNRTLYQKIPRYDAMWYAILTKDGNTIMPFGGACIPGGPESTDSSFASMPETIERYEKIIGAPRIPNPGMHQCVISPGVAGLLAHEAFGHGTETDMYLKRRSKGAEFTNKRVAARGVSMIDSPLRPGLPGSYYFDDEGFLAEETIIIDDGILVSGLTDMNSAAQLKIKRTPNGRRQDYSHKSYSRMTNTYFGAGNHSYEEMVASVDKGYVIELPSNGMEDPKGWGLQCEMKLAREIVNGEVTDNYFTPVIMTGYVPDILNSITMAGKDLEFFSLGACGKGKVKEMVRVSYGGPWLNLTARIA
jgi:TldD protein